MKTMKWWIILGVLGFVLFFGREYLIALGTITNGAVLGFDVDSEENIYIGTMKQILVYKDGTLLRTINQQTSEAYRFYIKNDQLIIGYEEDGEGGRYDLEGNELSYGEFSYDEIKAVASKKNISVNGHQYKLIKNLGFTPYKITCDGVEVYRMPALDYFFNGPPYVVVSLIFWMSAGIFLSKLLPEVFEAKEKGEDPLDVIFR